MREPRGGIKRAADRRFKLVRPNPAASWGDGAADYSTLRRFWLQRICDGLLLEELQAAPPAPWVMRFTWAERDGHRDPDGVRAGGTKLILDAFVKVGLLPNDTRAFVVRFDGDDFVQAGSSPHLPSPGVRVFAWPADGPRPERTWSTFVRGPLPDMNELLAARELGARRQLAAALRYRR